MAATNERRRILTPLGYGGHGPSVPLLMALSIIWLATGFQQCGVQASSSGASASSVADRRRSSPMSSEHHLLAAASSRKSRDVRYSDSRTAARQPTEAELKTLIDQTAQAEQHLWQPSSEFLFDPNSFSSSLASAVQLSPSGTPVHRRNLKHSVEGRELLSSPSTARSSRRKKLKADVFYAMRGRRRFDPLEDSSEQEAGAFDEGPSKDTDVKTGDGKTNLAGTGVDGMWDQSASLAINDDGDGSHRVKDKREPPTGFHAMRGKRHLRF